MNLKSVICLFYFVLFVKGQNCTEPNISENFWFFTTIVVIFTEVFCLLICLLSFCCCYCLKKITKNGKMTKLYYVSYKRRSQVANETERNLEDSNVYATINSNQIGRHLTDVSYLSNQTERKECRLSRSNPTLQLKDESFYENNENCVYDYVFIAKAPSENNIYYVVN